MCEMEEPGKKVAYCTNITELKLLGKSLYQTECKQHSQTKIKIQIFGERERKVWD